VSGFRTGLYALIAAGAVFAPVALAAIYLVARLVA